MRHLLLTKLHVTKVKGVSKGFFSLIGLATPVQERRKEQGQEYVGRKKRENLGAGQPSVSLIALTLTSKTLSESTEKTKKKKIK